MLTSILALYGHYEAEGSLSVAKDSNIVGSAQTQRPRCHVLLHRDVINEGTYPLRFKLILAILFCGELLRLVSREDEVAVSVQGRELESHILQF